MKLILGDSKIKLKDLPENSVDSVVLDGEIYIGPKQKEIIDKFFK